jgi:hypothetical protein
MSAEVLRKGLAVLGDARLRWRLLTDERLGGIGHQVRPDQPYGGRKPIQQGPRQACGVVPLVNGQTMFRMGAAREQRRKSTPIAAD